MIKEFSLNGRIYVLTFNGKPVLMEDGLKISNKTLSVIRDYVNANNINLSFVNSKGNPKNTYSIVKEFLNYKHKKDSKKFEKKSIPKVLEKSCNFGVENRVDKSRLLIIACSDKKATGGVSENGQNYFLQNNENECFIDLIQNRAKRLKQYKSLFQSNKQYFVKKGKDNSRYYRQCVSSGKLLPAYLRYEGKFYSTELRNQYLDKTCNANLHILIISGLYGILEFRDDIIDYHLGISKFKTIWNSQSETINDCVVKYMQSKNISNEDVYYAVSPSTYKKPLNPLPEWNNLWVTGGWGANAAKQVLLFLSSLNSKPH
jgi:hypothetical protein